MSEVKTCTKCNLEKDIKYFEFRSDTQRHRNHCKMCNKGYTCTREDQQRIIQELYVTGFKKCSKCETIKPLESFNIDKQTTTGRTSYCKECIKDKYTKEEIRSNGYKSRYKIDLNDYDIMYATQYGKCDICKEPFDKLVVDHCHTTGNVRSLLCGSCNFALGFFKDSVTSLENAIVYLQKHTS